MIFHLFEILTFLSILTTAHAGSFYLNAGGEGPYEITHTDMTSVDSVINGAPKGFNRYNKALNVARCVYKGTCPDVFLYSIKDTRDELMEEFSVEEANAMVTSYVAGVIAGASGEPLREKIFAEAQYSLTFEQKISVVQILGQLMASNYDFTRVSGGDEGIVSTEQIFESISKSGRAGVCRDMAVAQAQTLSNLGLKKSYVVAFKSTHGGHATVIVQDSDDPSKVVQYNYSDTNGGSSQGIGGLTQRSDLPDAGTTFRVFDSNGKPIDQVPSEIGFVLTKMSGMDTDKIAPGVEARGVHIIDTGYENSYLKVNVFGSQTSNGEQSYGMGVSLKAMGIRSSNGAAATIQFGAAFHKSELTDGDLEVDKQGVMFQFKTGLISPRLSYKALEDMHASVEYARTQYFGVGHSKNGEYEFEEDIQDMSDMLTVGLHTKFDVKNYKIISKIEGHASILKSDVRDESSRGLNVIGATITNEISRSLSKKREVVLENKIYIRRTGSTMKNSIVVRSKDGSEAYEVGFASPLTGEAPFWVVGSSKEASVAAKKEFFNGIATLKVAYIRKIDFDENIFNLNLNVKFDTSK